MVHMMLDSSLWVLLPEGTKLTPCSFLTSNRLIWILEPHQVQLPCLEGLLAPAPPHGRMAREKPWNEWIPSLVYIAKHMSYWQNTKPFMYVLATLRAPNPTGHVRNCCGTSLALPARHAHWLKGRELLGHKQKWTITIASKVTVSYKDIIVGMIYKNCQILSKPKASSNLQ